MFWDSCLNWSSTVLTLWNISWRMWLWLRLSAMCHFMSLILRSWYWRHSIWLSKRITRKIIKHQFRVTTKSFVGNFYQFGGPVPHSSFECILVLFNNGVVRNVNILLRLLARLCNINTILYYSRLFQQCIRVLCGVRQRIFHIRMWKLMSQPMYKIPSGSLQNFYVCETCGSVLDIYINFHRCLLQPDIVCLHLEVIKGINSYPFYHCSKRHNSVRDYMNHTISTHKSVVVFSCTFCGIAFITKSGLQEHIPHCSQI